MVDFTFSWSPKSDSSRSRRGEPGRANDGAAGRMAVSRGGVRLLGVRRRRGPPRARPPGFEKVGSRRGEGGATRRPRQLDGLTQKSGPGRSAPSASRPSSRTSSGGTGSRSRCFCPCFRTRAPSRPATWSACARSASARTGTRWGCSFRTPSPWGTFAPERGSPASDTSGQPLRSRSSPRAPQFRAAGRSSRRGSPTNAPTASFS